MSGRRVFVSGVGGELGTLVARMLEDEPWVGSLAGIDADPPRRRLQRTTYHRLSPDNHDQIVETIADFNPHVLVHVGVWEPDARASPKAAGVLTKQAATSILGAAAECRALENIVVRSGIEIYGRSKGSLTRPAEDAPIRPTSEYGQTPLRHRSDRCQRGRTSRRHGRRRATCFGPRPSRPIATRSPAPDARRAVQRAYRPTVHRD